MRLVLIAALALALAACTHGGKTAEKPVPQVAATPAEVVSAGRAAVEQWRQAYEIKSLDALAKLYAHDSDVVLVQEGTALVGWPSIEGALKDRLARANAIHVRLKDVQVASLAPSVATAVAQMTREIATGATTVTESGTLSLVLEKQGDAWVIALEHYSYKRP